MNKPRPHYETADDLEQERSIIGEVLRTANATPFIRFRFEGLKLDDTQYRIDWGVFRGPPDMASPLRPTSRLVLAALVECKRRSIRHDHPGGVWVSLEKFRRLRSFGALGIVCAFAFRFVNGIYISRAPNGISRPVICLGGRTDRGDPRDLEPAAVIPALSWKPLETIDFRGW